VRHQGWSGSERQPDLPQVISPRWSLKRSEWRNPQVRPRVCRLRVEAVRAGSAYAPPAAFIGTGASYGTGSSHLIGTGTPLLGHLGAVLAKHQRSYTSATLRVMSVVGYTRASTEDLCLEARHDALTAGGARESSQTRSAGPRQRPWPRRTPRLRMNRGYRHCLDRLGRSLSAVRAPSWPLARTYS